MTDLGNLHRRLALACHRCGWRPPTDMTVEVVDMHCRVEHDLTLEETELDLVAVCSCGEAMTLKTSRLTGGGIKDYMECGVCGNTGFVRRNAT